MTTVLTPTAGQIALADAIARDRPGRGETITHVDAAVYTDPARFAAVRRAQGAGARTRVEWIP